MKEQTITAATAGTGTDPGDFGSGTEFIAAASEKLNILAEEKGRSLKSCVVTFGCQMNARDSEKLRGVLRSAGFENTDAEEEADFIIYNTCTVRENADNHVYGRLGVLKGYKKRNPDLIVALCGCMMQEEHVVARIKKSFPIVELIFGTHNLAAFPRLLDEVLENRVKQSTANSAALGQGKAVGLRNGGEQKKAVGVPVKAKRARRVIEIAEKTEEIPESLPQIRKYPFKAGVNIMYGCNNFCTYCIVPFVRGRELSRDADDILEEVRRLTDDGAREIMLLGQNVNSYGNGRSGGKSFPELLAEVAEVPGVDRVRFMTSHPKDLSDELVDVIASHSNICRHIHLPVQSGSSRVLKLMNRRYTREHYLERVEKIRAGIPDVSLTTDLIVGFPGETEEDFEETLSLVREVKYDTAFTFLYSKRSGTPAAKMADQIPDDVAHARFDRLLAAVKEEGERMSSRFTGQVVPVLVEEKNREEGLVTGRMSQNLVVHLPGNDSLIGQIVDVRLVESRGFYYFGELV